MSGAARLHFVSMSEVEPPVSPAVLKVLDNFTWISVSQHVVWNIFGDDASCTYCYIVSYGHSGKYD